MSVVVSNGSAADRRLVAGRETHVTGVSVDNAFGRWAQRRRAVVGPHRSVRAAFDRRSPRQRTRRLRVPVPWRTVMTGVRRSSTRLIVEVDRYPSTPDLRGRCPRTDTKGFLKPLFDLYFPGDTRAATVIHDDGPRVRRRVQHLRRGPPVRRIRGRRLPMPVPRNRYSCSRSPHRRHRFRPRRHLPR